MGLEALPGGVGACHPQVPWHRGAPWFYDDQRHHLPHIHVQYGDQDAVFDITEGQRLSGELPRAKERLVLAWLELHRDELAADWQLAVRCEAPFRIEPLR